jgi:hypothetical protein
VRHGYGI